MVENLKQKAAKGIMWKFLEQGGTQVIYFVAAIFIARILSPQDYGLVGMLAIFIAISTVFVDGGLKATLIQKGNETTSDDYNVVFLFNVGISILIYSILYFSAPLIAQFFNEHRLIMITRILGLNLIISSLGIIHSVTFEKRLNFRTLSKIRIISTTVSVSTGLILAINGYGVWALVFMTLSGSLTTTILLWIINRWYPNFSFNVKVFKSLFSNGGNILLSGLIQQVYLNGYSFAIGKFFTTADVGFYSQGKKLQSSIGDFIMLSIQHVMFPVQSLLKDDIPRLKNAIRKNVRITTLLSFPSIFGLIAVAKPFIQLALTEKWLPSVYYIQVLAFASLFYVLSGSTGSSVMALGKFKIHLRLSILSTGLLSLLIIIGIFFKLNIKELVLGTILSEAINFFLLMYFSKKLIKYSVSEVLKDIFPSLVFSIIMGIVVYSIGLIFGISYKILILQIVCGGSIYFGLSYVFNREIFFEILDFVKSIKNK